MELLVNDLSFGGQFSDLPTFHEAIERVMTMRLIARQFGHELYCHRKVASAKVTPTHTMPQAVQSLERSKQTALLSWLTRNGPFWDDEPVHAPSDYIDCDGNVVTDTAIGEAALCCIQGTERRLVSLAPSDWEYSPIKAKYTPDSGSVLDINIINYWLAETLENVLRVTPAPVSSWGQLEKICHERCPDLTFAPNCFEPLNGHPFISRTAERVIVLLDVLNQIKRSLNPDGSFTAEGKSLHQTYFTGVKGLFSDSSDTEKKNFKKELTFPHPTISGRSKLYTWHGKIKTPQTRIHFSWPIQANEPLHIVYVGPKITKK